MICAELVKEPVIVLGRGVRMASGFLLLSSFVKVCLEVFNDGIEHPSRYRNPGLTAINHRIDRREFAASFVGAPHELNLLLVGAHVSRARAASQIGMG
jgi:hypothetical protein